MGFNDIFTEMESSLPSNYDETTNLPASIAPQAYQPMYPQFDALDQSIYACWDDYALGIRGIPTMYNTEAYVSPFVQNWINPSGLIGELTSEMQLNAENQRLDPNKIFSPDITSMKALAADQQKIVKLFEARLKESLTERGKVGLTEEDIEAMQALTAARTAISNMNKAQVDIKKNIADIRLKQQQNVMKIEGNDTLTSSGKALNAYDAGHSIMNNLFTEMDHMTPPSQAQSNITPIMQETSLDDASKALDNALPMTDVTEHIRYEKLDPTTYVLIGDTDDDIEYVTYASDGSLIPDYPNPTSPIEKIDRDAGTAVDDKFVIYPLKNK